MAGTIGQYDKKIRIIRKLPRSEGNPEQSIGHYKRRVFFP